MEGITDVDVQLQPNGFDLTVMEIALFSNAGEIDFSNERRRLPAVRTLEPDHEGVYFLSRGAYLITFREIVHIPNNVMAIGRPRSTLLRLGATIESAVWDAGFSGRGQSLLTVMNEHGVTIHLSARVMQLVFFDLSQQTSGYSGIYGR